MVWAKTTARRDEKHLCFGLRALAVYKIQIIYMYVTSFLNVWVWLPNLHDGIRYQRLYFLVAEIAGHAVWVEPDTGQICGISYTKDSNCIKYYHHVYLQCEVNMAIIPLLDFHRQ